jgi:HEAT repeat protein
MFVAVAICVAGFVGLDASVLSRIRDRHRMVFVHGGLALSMILLNGRISGWVVPCFYVWIEVTNVLLIIELWNLASEVFDPRQAKRLFGLIGSGGSLAAILTGFAVRPFVTRFGIEAMLPLLSILILSAGALALASLGLRRPTAHPRRRQQQVRSRMHFNPYFVSIAALVALGALVTVITDYQFKILASNTFVEEGALISFLGEFYGVVNIITLLLQILAVGVLTTQLGILAGLLFIPSTVFLGSVGLLISPGILAGALTKGAEQVGKFTFQTVSIELLWTPVSVSKRRALKPIINGTVKTIAEAATGLLIFILLSFDDLESLSVLVMLSLGCWCLVAFRLRSLYSQTLARAIERREIEVGEVVIGPLDAATIKMVAKTLLKGTELQQLFILRGLHGMPLGPWRRELEQVFREGPMGVRQQIMELCHDQPEILSNQTLLQAAEARDELSADAIGTLGQRNSLEVLPLITQLLANGSPDLRAASARALLQLSGGQDEDAKLTMNSLLNGSCPESVAALNRIDPAFYRLNGQQFRRLLASKQHSVQLAALDYARRFPENQFIPWIISMAKNDAPLMEIRRTLKAFPSAPVVNSCLEALTTCKQDYSNRLAVVRILRDHPDPSALEVLLRLIEKADLILLEAITDTVREMLTEVPLPLTAPTILSSKCEQLAFRACYFNRLLSMASWEPNSELLRDYYEHQYRRFVTALLKLRVLHHPEFPLTDALAALQNGDSGSRSLVIELFEGTLGSLERARVLPLLELDSPRDRDSQLSPYYPGLPDDLIKELEKGVYSRESWYSAICLAHLLDADRTLRIDRLDWQQVPITAIHRELLTRTVPMDPQRFVDAFPFELNMERANLPMYSILERTIILSSLSLFEKLPAETLSGIAQIVTELQMEEGTRLFSYGDQGDSLFVIASGEVLIHRDHLPLSRLGPGACFGEMALLDGSSRSADATVEADAVIFQVAGEDFDNLMHSHKELMRGVIRLLASRLKESDEERLVASGNG